MRVKKSQVLHNYLYLDPGSCCVYLRVFIFILNINTFTKRKLSMHKSISTSITKLLSAHCMKYFQAGQIHPFTPVIDAVSVTETWLDMELSSLQCKLIS